MRLGLLLLILSLFTFSLPAEALFRRPAAAGTPAASFKNKQPRVRNALRTATPLERSNSTSESHASIAGLAAAVVCFLAFGLTGMALFLIPMFAFATFAVVMGAFGIYRAKRGYALAGLLGGFLCIVAGFIALANL